jgi:hypothetical protein
VFVVLVGVDIIITIFLSLQASLPFVLFCSISVRSTSKLGTGIFSEKYPGNKIEIRPFWLFRAGSREERDKWIKWLRQQIQSFRYKSHHLYVR